MSVFLRDRERSPSNRILKNSIEITITDISMLEDDSKGPTRGMALVAASLSILSVFSFAAFLWSLSIYVPGLPVIFLFFYLVVLTAATITTIMAGRRGQWKSRQHGRNLLLFLFLFPIVLTLVLTGIALK